MTNITMGADIEMVVHQGVNPKSVIGLIGGSKEKPLLVEHGNLQEDNVLAEFAIDPVTTEDDWVRNITSVRDSLARKLGGYELRVMSSVMFPHEELVHPLAKQFGCDPDFNAWLVEENTPPDPTRVGRLRTCGGHIHIGFELGDTKGLPEHVRKAQLIHWMDAYLGLPAVFLDSDKKRRSVYGKAGSFRDKPYGIEYRSLSSFWMKDERLMRWAYQSACKAYERFQKEDLIDVINEDQVDLLREGIDMSSHVYAKHMMRMLGIEMPSDELLGVALHG